MNQQAPCSTTALRGALALFLALLQPFSARATDRDEVRHYILSINRLYENLDYEVALSRIPLARKLPLETDEEVTLSLYEGILLCELRKQAPGAAAFRAALLLRPEAKLPVQVAPKVEALFESVRNQVKQEVKQELLLAAERREAERREAERQEAERQEAERKEAERQEAERKEAERREFERAQLKKKARDAANLDTSKCQPAVSVACEQLMKRLRSLQVAFLRTDSPSRPTPLRELSMIGQEIRAARSKEELQEAAHALDSWQQRQLPR